MLTLIWKKLKEVIYTVMIQEINSKTPNLVPRLFPKTPPL
jgi:hypothetical protein